MTASRQSNGAAERLTSPSLLARNVGMNLVGWGLPAVAALVALPLLVGGLGEDRFGALALAWTTLGYFSLFDLGIGRALTHAVADRIGHDRESEIGGITWTALGIILPLGAMGAAIMYALAPWLATKALEVPQHLQAETVTAFRILALAIPFTGAAAVLRGVLEAKQRFGMVNALRVPYGLLVFLGPLAALPFSQSLVPGIALLTGGRVALFLAHLIACVWSLPAIRVVRWDRTMLGPLMTFGGWMTISNLVSPLMVTMDRFVVGAVLGVSTVTYYATPQEVATKMWLFTAALLPVFFPAFATSAVSDPARASRLFDRVMRTTLAALFLPTAALVLLANEGLTIWVGPEFAARSATVLQVLSIAVFVNVIGQCAFTLIQALGRPDLTGKFHLIELPIYGLLLWFLLPRFGLLGVALAWNIRTIADSLVLLLTCPMLLRDASQPVARILVWMAVAVSALVGAMFVPTTAARLTIFVIAVPAWIVLAWWRLLTPTERSAPLRALAYTRD